MSAERLAVCAVAALASAIALASARPWVGSWNDGSRLATVESLVDRHTLAIDDSIFVRPPSEAAQASVLLTKDRLLIDGRFYSDKPPVPALLTAAVYGAWRWAGGPTAAAQPGRFAYWMTVSSSGAAYVVAVVAIFMLSGALGLGGALRGLLTASFGLATLALPYARHVNAHIVLLAVAAALLLALTRLAQRGATRARLLAIGTLAGFGYTIDLASGPLLLAAVLALVACRAGAGAAAQCGLAALPWIGLHHAVNYAVGGTFLPANMTVQYFAWPESPFILENMTGVRQHEGVVDFAEYAAALWVGRRGFLDHNLPVAIVLFGAALWRARPAETPELVVSAAWCAATWLVYALGSNNYSGECASVRWFVPLLAPAYLAAAIVLRERQHYVPYFAILSGWGAVLAARMWIAGPWARQTGAAFWLVQLAALASCLIWRRYAGASAAGRGAPPWRARMRRASRGSPAAGRGGSGSFAGAFRR